MLYLKFKVKNVRKVERESGKSFFEMLAGIEKMSSDDLAFLLECGGLSADEAEDFIDENGLEVATFEISKGLKDAGFLPKAAREQIGKSVAEIEKSLKSSSGESGKNTKSKQSQSA